MKLFYDTITDEMNAVASKIFEHFDTDYYLAGGTSLSLQIGHRKSVDLDYFIKKEISTQELQEDLFEIFGKEKVEILFTEKNTLWCKINGIKLSFISRFDKLSEDILIIDNYRLASIKDILLMKLSTICAREEYKDYFDLACISQIIDVREWVNIWSNTYPNINYTSWLIALSYVDKIQIIPLDISSSYKNLNIQNTIKNTVSEITRYLEKI